MNFKREIFFVLFFLFSVQISYAESDYVLPYPSFMPGNPLYKIDLLKDEILKYWYFGNFGQFKYSLKLADKYLVEAKTLFEYKQYLLAVNALKKSDFYFNSALPALIKAKDEGKDVSQNTLLLKEAKLKHIEVLQEISRKVPENFLWQPEKARPTQLKLKKLLENSISLRDKV